MELNESVLNAIASSVKMQSEDLKSALTNPDAKFEMPELKVFKSDELETLESNIQKQGYEKGKTAGEEMFLKDMKQTLSDELNIDTKGIKDWKELLSKVTDVKSSELKTKISDLENERTEGSKLLQEKYELQVKSLSDEKSALQNMINEIKTDFNNQLLQKTNEVKNFKSKHELNRLLDNFNWNVPADVKKHGDEAISNYLAVEKQKSELLFQSLHKLDYNEEGKLIVYDSKGEIIKDELQNPEKLVNVLNKFAKQYNFNLKSDTNQRAKGSKQYQKDFAGMSLNDFESQMQNLGIHKGSNEFIKRLADYKKANT